MHRNSLPSTLQSPSVVPNSSSSLQHALSLPNVPQQQQQHQFIQPHAIHHQQPPKSQMPVQNIPFPTSSSSTQQSSAVSAPITSDATAGQNGDRMSPEEEAPPAKRRRGRPKGSKTKNRRIDGVLQPINTPSASTSAANAANHALVTDEEEERDELTEIPNTGSERPTASASQTQPSTLPLIAPPVDPTDDGLGSGMGSANSPSSPGFALTPVTSFYDFQWRVMNLCSQFYEAAGELVRLTSPEILAQSFQLGSRADPLMILNNAKEICDFMMAKPGTLAQGTVPSTIPTSLFPPPPASAYHQPMHPYGIASTSHGVMDSSTGLPTPSFPLHSSTSQPSFPQSTPFTATQPLTPWAHSSKTISNDGHSDSHPPGTGQTGEAGSEYSGGAYGGTLLTQSSLETLSAPSAPFGMRQSVSISDLPGPKNMTGVPSVHGAWKDWETQRLMMLAEQSKQRTATGEIDWDWTVDQFGETRSRHQILIKATALNLKPTSTHPSRQKKRSGANSSSSHMAPPNQPSDLASTLMQNANDSSGSSSSLDGSAVQPSTHMADNRDLGNTREAEREEATHPPQAISPSASLASTPVIHQDRHHGDTYAMDKPMHVSHAQYSNQHQQRTPSSKSSIQASPSHHDSRGLNQAMPPGHSRPPSSSMQLSHGQSAPPSQSPSMGHSTQQSFMNQGRPPDSASSQSMSGSRSSHMQQNHPLPQPQPGASPEQNLQGLPHNSRSAQPTQPSQSAEHPAQYHNQSHTSSHRGGAPSQSQNATHQQAQSSPSRPYSSHRSSQGHTNPLQSPHDNTHQLALPRQVGPPPQSASSGSYPNTHPPAQAYVQYSPSQPHPTDASGHSRRDSVNQHPSVQQGRPPGRSASQYQTHSQGSGNRYYS